ncbi:MAG: hypothetical protein HGB19_09330, partial [Chlorobiales bacterium]|nr:hypothetical protein [Chlorobiales bacterium]
MRKIIATIMMVFVGLFSARVIMAQLPGSLDLSFGRDYKLTTDFGFGSFSVESLILQKNDKVVAVGGDVYSNSTLAV